VRRSPGNENEMQTHNSKDIVRRSPGNKNEMQTHISNDIGRRSPDSESVTRFKYKLTLARILREDHPRLDLWGIRVG